MAGCPIRRAGKTGAVDPVTHEVIVIPRLAIRHRCLEAARLEPVEPGGLSLDRMREYLSWPADGLDPYRLAAQVQVIGVLAMVAAKVGERRPDPEVAERFRQAMERTATLGKA